jgi:hypothetical protein
MTADELIDSYVADVVLLLPRKQRRDVAQELRVLLREEVDAAAEAHASREDAARALLAGFGRPADVAARYGSPVTLIDPADSRRFLTLAAAGAVLIPLGAVLNEFSGQPGSRQALGLGLEKAWPIVFAWLGLLVTGFAVAAWARRRQPDTGWKPHPMPTDRISRPGRAAAITFFILGTLALVDPAWLIRTLSGGHAAPAAYHAFAYDEGFLRLRGPVVLALMIAGLIILAILVWQGRWRPWIRQAEIVQSLATCVVLTWAVAAGPVFQATPTDRAVKGAASLLVLVTLVDLAVRTSRHHAREAVQIQVGDLRR